MWFALQVIIAVVVGTLCFLKLLVSDRFQLFFFAFIWRHSIGYTKVERARCASSYSDETYTVSDCDDRWSKVHYRMLSSVTHNCEPENIVKFADGFTLGDDGVPLANSKLDHDFLMYEICRMMLAALLATDEMADRNTEARILFIGCGAATAPRKLRRIMPNADITIVEIDAAVIKLVKEWFEFEEDSQMHLVLEDGIKYMEKCAKESSKYDAILLDVTVSEAFKEEYPDLSAPLPQFLDDTVIKNIAASLNPMGSLVVNLIAGKKTRQSVKAKYQKHFPLLYAEKIQYLLPMDEQEMFIGRMRNGGTMTATEEFQKLIKPKIAEIYEAEFGTVRALL